MDTSGDRSSARLSARGVDLNVGPLGSGHQEREQPRALAADLGLLAPGQPFVGKATT